LTEDRIILQADKTTLKSEIVLVTTEKAVQIQIYSAIVTYTFIVAIKNKFKSLRSNYEIF